MSVATLPVIPPTLASGFCFESWQQIANALVGGAVVQLDVTGATMVLNQNSTPAATDRDKLWYNYDTGRVLRWNTGVTAWTVPHGSPAGGYERRLWVGTLVQLETYDGGSAGAVSSTSGPMWTQDTAFNDRFPLGVGAVAATPLATGGAMTATIAQANLPAVQLDVSTAIIGQSTVGAPEPVVGATYGSTAVAGSGLAVDSTSSSLASRYYTKGRTDALGSGTALSVQNSYVGIYVIKRTARVYYTS